MYLYIDTHMYAYNYMDVYMYIERDPIHHLKGDGYST